MDVLIFIQISCGVEVIKCYNVSYYCSKHSPKQSYFFIELNNWQEGHAQLKPYLRWHKKKKWPGCLFRHEAYTCSHAVTLMERSACLKEDKRHSSSILITIFLWLFMDIDLLVSHCSQVRSTLLIGAFIKCFHNWACVQKRNCCHQCGKIKICARTFKYENIELYFLKEKKSLGMFNTLQWCVWCRKAWNSSLVLSSLI